MADGPLPASSLRESWEPNATSGLGDRERSISPAADDTTDAWDTMLTTIAPDAQLPSFDSSFTSAAASASASFSAGRSNNNSQSRSGSGTRSSSASEASARTHITVPSPALAPHRSTDPECTTDNEHSFDSGSDTEDDANILATSERLARTRHPRSPPSRRSQPRSTAEMRETLRNRPWRTSAVRDEPGYQAAAELRRITARRQGRQNHPDYVNGDIVRLQEHSRELDRQFDELRNMSADLDRRQAERQQRDRDRESERRLGLPPMSPQRRAEHEDGPEAEVVIVVTGGGEEEGSTGAGEREHDVSRFISHFESFRAARDAARRDLRDATERRVEAEHDLAESMSSAAEEAAAMYSAATLSADHHEAVLDGEMRRARDATAGAEISGSVRDDPTLSRDEMLGNDPELEGMRAILERMSRRDDIPNWWWESAGLSTAIPRDRL